MTHIQRKLKQRKSWVCRPETNNNDLGFPKGKTFSFQRLIQHKLILNLSRPFRVLPSLFCPNAMIFPDAQTLARGCNSQITVWNSHFRISAHVTLLRSRSHTPGQACSERDTNMFFHQICGVLADPHSFVLL